jgi:hypothetical protein
MRFIYMQNTLCNSGNREKFCSNGTYDHCSCTHVIEVDTNDLVEFILVDSTYTKLPDTILVNKHPIHLHGHQFAVVAIQEVAM